MNPQNSNPLLLIWSKPRTTIRHLTATYSPIADLRLIALLSFAYFAQIALFILSIEEIPISTFFNFKALNAMLWTLVALALGFYTYANCAALITWTIARWFKGKGDLASTRTALLWSILCYLPVGLFFLFVRLTFKLEDLGKPVFLIKVISHVGLPAALIYSSVLMLKMVAETHRFSLVRAFVSLVLCGVVQAGLLVLVLAAFRKGG